MGIKLRTAGDAVEVVQETRLEELREALEISKDSLDDDVMRQPMLYDEVADTVALLTSQRDQANSNLKEVDAELTLAVRSRIARKGEKITVDEVNSQVILDPRYQKAKRKLDELELRVARWTVLKDSFTKRGYMLTQLCDLYMSGYWQKNSHKGGARGDALVRGVHNQLKLRKTAD